MPGAPEPVPDKVMVAVPLLLPAQVGVVVPVPVTAQSGLSVLENAGFENKTNSKIRLLHNHCNK